MRRCFGDRESHSRGLSLQEGRAPQGMETTLVRLRLDETPGGNVFQSSPLSRPPPLSPLSLPSLYPLSPVSTLLLPLTPFHPTSPSLGPYITPLVYNVAHNRFDLKIMFSRRLCSIMFTNKISKYSKRFEYVGWGT